MSLIIWPYYCNYFFVQLDALESLQAEEAAMEERRRFEKMEAEEQSRVHLSLVEAKKQVNQFTSSLVYIQSFHLLYVCVNYTSHLIHST